MKQENEEKYREFMKNRNGPDLLGNVSFWIGIILCAVCIVIPSPARYYLLASGLILIAYFIFRLFSTHFYQRQRENEFFLKIVRAPLKIFHLGKRTRKAEPIDGDPEHMIVRCPHCDQRIRLPNRRGRHGVCCPACKKDFKVKI